MQQIRFDFFNGVNGGTNRSGTANANAAEQSGDAFARILDQQLARRGDDRTKTRAAEPRSRAEAGEVADDRRSQVAKRRDAKAVSSSASPEKPEAQPAKAKQPEKPAAETTTCAKPATKPQTEETDPTAEAAAGTPATTDAEASGGTTEAEDQAETPDDQHQHATDEGAQQAATDAEPGEAVAAETDLSLLAMLAVSLPLQTLTAEVDGAVDATALAAGGNAAALDAALAAQLAGQLAGQIGLGAAVGGKAEGQAATGGLKFGAILAGTGDPQKAAAAALEDAVAELAKAADPLTQLAAEASGKKGEAATGKDAKTRETAPDKAAATVTPELKAQAQAAIVQPMARGAGVTWSGTTSVRNELAESMAMQAGAGFAADDAEFSNWSQFLGAGAAGLSNNLAARQSAFMAHLKANLQNLPPHEQIAVQIKDAMQNGNSRLTVALHPVELGRVEVKLDIDKDKNVTATIIVDRPGTLDLLRNDAKALERALQDAGLQTDSGSLSFNLRDGRNGESGNGTGTGNGSGHGPGGSGSEVKAEVRADVVQTADGYVDLET